MGYDRVEQIREGVLGDWLEGNIWEEGLPSCIQSKLECLHGWSVHNFLFPFVPVRDCSNTKRMLAATGFTPLLVNLQSMTSKPSAGGAAKTASCIILYIQIRSPRILLRIRENSCSHWRAASYEWRIPFTNFTARLQTLPSAWQSRERMPILLDVLVIFKQP